MEGKGSGQGPAPKLAAEEQADARSGAGRGAGSAGDWPGTPWLKVLAGAAVAGLGALRFRSDFRRWRRHTS